MTTKWDSRFLRIANEVATWSKDPSTQVGCVLVNEKRHIISTGYNGFPRDVTDKKEWLGDRSVKYSMVIHAEVNAVLQTEGDCHGATAYVTHRPCANCSAVLVQSGIKRIVSFQPDVGLAERFKDSFAIADTLLHEAGVDVTLHETELWTGGNDAEK